MQSESSFIDMDMYDACVDPLMGHVVADPALICWAAVDASVKHDSTALMCMSWDQINQRVRAVDHRIFVPTSDAPIDFSTAVEATLLDWHRRFSLQAVWYDPFQMAATAQSLARQGVVMFEYPQTLPNLTAMAENLYGLIKGRNLLLYRDEEIRTAVMRSIAVEGKRGWKIDKEKQSHRIDITIALGMAALAAVTAQANAYDYSGKWIDGIGIGGGDGTPAVDQRSYAAQQLNGLLQLGVETGGAGSGRQFDPSLMRRQMNWNASPYQSPFRRGFG